MTFTPPAPIWISTDDALSAGQDFMALRNPANRIGYVAMNGLTSVTPRVRYLSFREWMLATWWKARGEDRRAAFTDFAQRVEAAIVLANLRAGVSINGLIGSDKGPGRLAQDEPWSLAKLVENPGAIIYAGATEQLGLDTTQFEQGGSLVVRAIAGPTLERGQKLAGVLGDALTATRLGREIAAVRVPEVTDAAALDELAELVRLDRVPEAERNVLVDVLLPLQADPGATPELRSSELRRIGSYTLLLELARRQGGTPTEQDVFRVAAEGGLDLPPELHPILDVWALFSVRDVLAACHEASMCALTEALETLAGGGEATSQQVLDEVLAQGDVLGRALGEFGLLTGSEHWNEMGFRELYERVSLACSSNAWDRRGVRRWQDGLSEGALASAALRGGAGPGPLALVPVAWALVTLRMAPALAGEPSPFFEHLCTHPFPVRPHIERAVAEWLEDDPPLPELVARLAMDSMWLHLDTAWTRMQSNVRSDTAHLHVEGDTWRPRRVWRPGRGTSRLDNAIGWLVQLELIDEGGLTPRGGELHAAALATLGAEVTP